MLPVLQQLGDAYSFYLTLRSISRVLKVNFIIGALYSIYVPRVAIYFVWFIRLAHCKYVTPYVTVVTSVVCLSLPRQISKTKQDSREISSPLWEICVAEQEYDVIFCTGSS